MSFKRIKQTGLRIGERWCESFLVTYPVSYRYNGGTIVGNKWYEGFVVAAPKVPKGFEIVGIGCGLQLNAQPPYATQYLKPINGKRIMKKELQAILAKKT